MIARQFGQPAQLCIAEGVHDRRQRQKRAARERVRKYRDAGHHHRRAGKSQGMLGDRARLAVRWLRRGREMKMSAGDDHVIHAR